MKITQLIIILTTLTVVVGLPNSALAAKMSKDAYNTERSKAEMDYKIAKQNCDSFSGNAKDICMAEAKGAESVAKADAKAKYKGTEEARLDAMKTKVNAEYQVAKERCDDFSGNKKAVCRQEARAAKVKGEEEAKLNYKKAEATSEKMKTETKARQEAGEVNRDAEYRVEIEKCDQYSGDAKDQCSATANSRFGK